MNSYSVRLRNERKQKLAGRVEEAHQLAALLDPNTGPEELNLENINDALDSVIALAEEFCPGEEHGHNKNYVPKPGLPIEHVKLMASLAKELKFVARTIFEAHFIESPQPQPVSPPMFEGETEEFNLKNLRRALTNISDVIEALEADPPRAEGALTNARVVKDAVKDAIDDYDDDYRPRRGIRVVSIPVTPTPPPPPLPGPGMQAEGQQELSTELAEEKTEAGAKFPESAYAYTPDPDMPSTWKLRLWASPDGGPDARIVGAAVAALGEGFRGNKVQIPAEDLPKVKAKVRAAWTEANPDKDLDEMPAAIKE